MSSVFKVKPRINKRNGQINFSLPKKKMSASLRGIFQSEPFKVKSMKIRMEDIEKYE